MNDNAVDNLSMIEPYYQSDCGRAVLYCGDALEVMPQLEAGSVDACIADPPYGFNYSSNHGASWAGSEIANDSDTSRRDYVIGYAERYKLPWAIFGSWKIQKPLTLRQMVIWDKGPAFGMGDLSFPFKNSFEEIYLGGTGWAGYRDEGVLRGHLVVSWESKGRCHQNQKPVSLLRLLIHKLPAAQTIFDPFAGSGSTGVAALQEGRKFIGIELSEEYCAIAKSRLMREGLCLPVDKPRRRVTVEPDYPLFSYD